MGGFGLKYSPGATVHLLRFNRTVKVAQEMGCRRLGWGTGKKQKDKFYKNERLGVLFFPTHRIFSSKDRDGAPSFIRCGSVRAVDDGFALK
jgi:hypothetical protein